MRQGDNRIPMYNYSDYKWPVHYKTYPRDMGYTGSHTIMIGVDTYQAGMGRIEMSIQSHSNNIQGHTIHCYYYYYLSLSLS